MHLANPGKEEFVSFFSGNTTIVHLPAAAALQTVVSQTEMMHGLTDLLTYWLLEQVTPRLRL
jgi:hypothetical protein